MGRCSQERLSKQMPFEGPPGRDIQEREQPAQRSYDENVLGVLNVASG